MHSTEPREFEKKNASRKGAKFPMVGKNFTTKYTKHTKVSNAWKKVEISNVVGSNDWKQAEPAPFFLSKH